MERMEGRTAEDGARRRHRRNVARERRARSSSFLRSATFFRQGGVSARAPNRPCRLATDAGGGRAGEKEPAPKAAVGYHGKGRKVRFLKIHFGLLNDSGVGLISKVFERRINDPCLVTEKRLNWCGVQKLSGGPLLMSCMTCDLVGEGPNPDIFLDKRSE